MLAAVDRKTFARQSGAQMVWVPQQPGQWAAWHGYQPIYPWHASPPMMQPYPQYCGHPYAPPFRPPPRPPRPPGNPSKAYCVKDGKSSGASPYKPSDQGPQNKQQVPAKDEQKSPPSGQKSSSSEQNTSQSSTKSSSASSWIRVPGVRYTGSSESQTEPSTPQSDLSRSGTLPTTLNPAALPFYPTHTVAHGVPAPSEQRPSVNKPQSHALVSRNEMSVRQWRPAAAPMRQAAPRMQADKQQHNLAQVADKSCSQLTEARAFQADPLPTLRRIRTRKVQSSTVEPCNSEVTEKVTSKLDNQPASAPEERPVSKVDEEAMSKSEGQPPTHQLFNKAIEKALTRPEKQPSTQEQPLSKAIDKTMTRPEKQPSTQQQQLGKADSKAMTRPEKQPSIREQPLSKSHQESITEASKQPPAPIEQQLVPKAERKARKLAKPIPLPPSPTETSPRVAHSHFKDAQLNESKSTHGAKVQQGRSSLQHAVAAQGKTHADPVKPGAENKRPEALSSYSISTPRPQPRLSIQPHVPCALTQSGKVENQFKGVHRKVAIKTASLRGDPRSKPGDTAAGGTEGDKARAAADTSVAGSQNLWTRAGTKQGPLPLAHASGEIIPGVDTAFRANAKDTKPDIDTSCETPSEKEGKGSQKLHADYLSRRAVSGSKGGSDSSLDILLDSPGTTSVPAAATAGLNVSGTVLS
ncbi:g5677 [Coccomyxa elongata]